MVTTTQNKNISKRLVEHFNKYVSYREQVKQSANSFRNQLGKVLSDDDSGERNVSRKQTNKGPIRLSNRPKHITNTQANRLAKYAPLIQEAAAKYNVPIELICGVILQESGGNARASSHAGAKGLMQLMPQTAKRFGVKDVYDPKQNIDGGTNYLSWLLKRFNGDISLTLAAYNAGEGNVEKYGNKIPPFAETQNYVPNVLGYTQTMVDILLASNTGKDDLPANARRV